jgi:hypothetical protein
VLALAMPLALLAGCSFGTAPLPGGYHCTKPQHPAGCATAIDFTHSHINPDSNPDIAGDPVYAYSDLLVVPLTCDAACQASSGGSPPGFIYNFMSMVQLPAGYYIEAGYTTTPSNGMRYFVQYFVPGVNNGQFTYVDLGPAPTGDGSNKIDYRYAHIAMGQQAQQTFFGPAGDWVVIIEPPYGSNGWLVQDLGKSTFQPNHVQYGQFIYGTSGATGLAAYFANNNIFATPFTAFHLQEIVTEDASPPSSVLTVDNPSDASWFIQASKSSSGGMFKVACC